MGYPASDPKLSARNLRKFGLRRSAYNGGHARRFCLFASTGNGNEMRFEYDSRQERDQKALYLLERCERAAQAA